MYIKKKSLARVQFKLASRGRVETATTHTTAVRVKTADRAGNVIKTVPAFSRMVTGRNGW
jgi:hypothetical protein